MLQLTSVSSPLRVDVIVPASAREGWLGATLAPGKNTVGQSGVWRRDLEADLRALVERGVNILVPLLTDAELPRLGIPRLIDDARRAGLEVIRFPIEDGGVASDPVAFDAFVANIVARIRGGSNVVVHCNGGLGRAGVVSACVRLAMRLDTEFVNAIASVRSARSPRAVENSRQEDFIAQFAKRFASADSSVRLSSADRRAGAWWGAITGDALGAPVEFMDEASILARFGRWSEMRAGGPWERGETTDDTALMLCNAKAYTEHGFVLEACSGAMVDWLARGPKDVGNLTRRALQLLSDGSATATNAGLMAVADSPGSAGNGALMRCLPTALLRTAGDTRLITETESLSRITHADARSVSACVAYNVVLAALLEGASPRHALLRAQGLTTNHDEVASIIARVLSGAQRRFVNRDGIGYVLLALEWALDALVTATDFENALVDVIARGGDTDTNAAIAGGLLGARFGARAIPTRWLDALLHRRELEAALTALVAAA